jgi:quinol monooxygenase YgiN
MIAQVHTGSGTPGAVPTDEQRKFVEDALAQGRAQDGCEATISLADPTTGDTLVINLFRDEAALDDQFQGVSGRRR